MGSKVSLNPNPSRCFQCLTIPFIDIITNDLEIKVKSKCLCGEKEYEIDDYLKKYSGKESPDFSCISCKKNIDNSFYCFACLKVYCNKCLSEHKDKNKEHIFIHLNRLDSECPFHSKFLSQYCFICEKNLCDKCNLNDHKGHIIVKFIDYKIKKMDILEKKIKMSKQKLDVNENIAKSIIAKNNKKKKEIKDAYEKNDEVNLKIIKLLEQQVQCYNMNKDKFNCQLIYNVKENINFNLTVIDFKENTGIEEDTQKIIEYFKTNTVIVKRGEIKKEKKKEEKKEIKEEEKKEGEDKKDIFNVDLLNYGNKYTENNKNDIYENGDPRKEERDNIMKRPVRNVKKKAKRPVFNNV